MGWGAWQTGRMIMWQKVGKIQLTLERETDK